MMLYRAAVPAAPLSDSIELLWACEPGDAPPATLRTLPEGTAGIVFALHDAPDSAIVYGPHSRPYTLPTRANVSVIGVHFRPGGASAFFPFPLRHLHNRVADLSVVWGGAAHALREALADAPAAERFRVLESALARRHSGRGMRPEISHALAAFSEEEHGGRIREALRTIGLSERRFIELFRDAVGLSPKRFCRVRRFQRVLRRIPLYALDGAGLAHECGYFDQAHLAHDFREFAGVTLSEYRARRGDAINHLPDTA